MVTIPIEEGLSLRSLEQEDAKELFALTDSGRAYLRRWLPWLDATRSLQDTRLFIESAQRQSAANLGFQSGIWSDGRLVGVIGYHHVDWPNRSTNIGYWLGEQNQGRGLMTKATRAVVDYAFDVWHMNRVEIRCAVENIKSRAIPERLGFKSEGLLREAEWLYDHFVDHVVYGMVAKEWDELRRNATR
jgi:ribosomal-protein-serine acetyltransferase